MSIVLTIPKHGFVKFHDCVIVFDKTDLLNLGAKILNFDEDKFREKVNKIIKKINKDRLAMKPTNDVIKMKISDFIT